MSGSKERALARDALASFLARDPYLEVGPALRASVAFVRPLLHGTCVGVRMTGGDEPDPAATPPAPTHDAPAPRISWGDRNHAGGRLALSAALVHAGLAADTIGAIGKSPRGAPITPRGSAGSISHKGDMAVGLAAPDDTWRVGVDLEAQVPTRRNIAPRVLTRPELDAVAAAPDERARALAVLLRFSIKEAIYKAIDPFVCRYVGFREVCLYPRPDGHVDIIAALDPAPRRPLEIQASWTEESGYFLSAARARER